MSFEEKDYYQEDRKSSRKERKRLQQKDRSKYKKSDRDKQTPKQAPPKGMRGLVVTVSGQEISVRVGNEEKICTLRGTLKQQRGDEKNLIVVGDHVYVNAQGQITEIEKRTSILSRTDNLSRKKRHIIAANIDQVYIVSSISHPTLKLSLIDRYIIAAKKGNMRPVVTINKIDLLNASNLLEEIAKIYAHLEIPLFYVSALTQTGIDALVESMKGHLSVFSGQSGVGKTSLINQITGSSYKTAEIIERTQKGAHTTTRAKLIEVTEDGYCIDTPGIRSFALWDITKQDILNYFSDLEQFAGSCKFGGCTHTHEPGCSVKKALEEGQISKLRFESYLSIWREHDENQDDPRI